MVAAVSGRQYREFQTPAGVLYLAPLADRAQIQVQIQAQIGAPIAYEPGGRPYLAGDRRHISIAHTRAVCGDWVVFLVGRQPCGVDIEWCERDAARVAVRVAETDEVRLAAKGYASNPPLATWCAKEAAFKAAAVRRDLDFRRQVRIVSEKHHTLFLQVEAGVVEVSFLEVDQLLLAVAKR